jgi:DNA-directed RNA polymerase specialized sigma24 family protein
MEITGMETLPSRKKAWDLTRESFEKFLALLDADRELAAEEYEQIRRKLVKIFQWRGSTSPEDHADETINRVARKIEEGETIRNLRSYVGGVARLVWLNYYREQKIAKITLRKELAQTLGIPANALRNRAHRIRAQLEKCVAECIDRAVSP